MVVADVLCDCVDTSAVVAFAVAATVAVVAVVASVLLPVVHFAYSVMPPGKLSLKLHSCVHALSLYQPPKV